MVIEFDHIAFAADPAQPLIQTLIEGLGATAVFGRSTSGFRWLVVLTGPDGNGLTIEVLEPWREMEDPFLRRFLDRRGAGAHHLTFKVDNLDASLTRLHRAGYTPVDVSLSNPLWKEAFLRPRDAHGTIVQLAESASSRPSLSELVRRAKESGPSSLLVFARGTGTAEIWWDPFRTEVAPVGIHLVVLGVESMRRARVLFEELLEGTVCVEGDDYVELCWQGCVRLGLEAVTSGSAGIVRLEGGVAHAAAPHSLLDVPLELTRPI